MKITEIFGHTIQGEGPFTGEPAIFVRTFGCVPPFCTFCDTTQSWSDKSVAKEMSAREVYDEVRKIQDDTKGNTRLVVITGGEPYMHDDVYELIEKLIDTGFKVQMETSGKAPISQKQINCDFTIVMSVKQSGCDFLFHDVSTLQKADYHKFVVGDDVEMEATHHFIERMNIDHNKVYIMPKGHTKEMQEKVMPEIVKMCVAHGYKMSPRLHTLIWDTKKGV